MISNLSLGTTVLVVSILISGILIPVGVFASPIFETDTTQDGDFYFTPEQSIGPPTIAQLQVSDLDVVVFNGTSSQEVFLSFTDPSKGISYLSFTNDQITNPNTGLAYFYDLTNDTSTVQLNENNVAGGTNFICNVASQPKVSVTDTHVFVTWLDALDDDGGGSGSGVCNGTAE